MTIQLGLIGENISKTRAPRLHEYLGRLCGLDVVYTPHDSEGVPGFDPIRKLHECAAAGYAGVNVTHPYKPVVPKALPRLHQSAALVGSLNTVVFGDDEWLGANTDYTGFIAGYRHIFGDRPPGRVLLLGAGGVGRAIAFALEELAETEIHIHDVMPERAEALAAGLRAGGRNAQAVPAGALAEVAAGVDGLINGTPIGMYKHPGLPLPAALIGGQRWAFDAVYTPLRTEFIQTCEAAGLAVMTGFELFFFQGLDAFRFFTGITVDPKAAVDEVITWMDGPVASST